MSNKDGGSAFPSEQSETSCGEWNQTFDPGMSLRDYFAAQSIAGLIRRMDGHVLYDREIAEAGYRIADAMLKEREKDKAVKL